MTDAGLSHFINQRLNRWYRRRAHPKGTVDHYHRGVRMGYTATYRLVTCGFSLLLLLAAGVLCGVRTSPADHSLFAFSMTKLLVVGLVLLALVAPLWASWEHVIFNEDEIIKPGLFGRKIRMKWQDIASYEITPDDNLVIFLGQGKKKLLMNLGYDGWQDFQDMAASHMNPALYRQFHSVLMNLDVKSPRKKLGWAKWISFGQKKLKL